MVDNQTGVVGATDDRRTFEKLVARTRRPAYSAAYRMTGNRDEAEDLVQEAYLRAYRSFGRYDRTLPFENWFFRILTNLFVDGLRRRPKQRALSLSRPISSPDGESDVMLDVPDPEADPEVITMRDQLDERLQHALERIPAEFRTAVMLCDVHGLRYDEIAAAMGTSIGTVRSRIHRGRKLLRKHLGGELSPTGVLRTVSAAV
jgi:RNA polymerase sigma-70 factor, ECF subfamily